MIATSYQLPVTIRNGGVFNLARVEAQKGESVDVLIRKFNKKVLAEGILNELKKREFYEKPSVIRKRERSARQRRLKHRDQEF